MPGFWPVLHPSPPGFKRGGLRRAELATLVEDAGDARAKLRLTHLAALKTLPVLTDEQVALYARLSGYRDQDMIRALRCRKGTTQ